MLAVEDVLVAAQLVELSLFQPCLQRPPQLQYQCLLQFLTSKSLYQLRS
ncbi:hypothetical protein Mgra_00009216, partial [Meloidogyne graminicola]